MSNINNSTVNGQDTASKDTFSLEAVFTHVTDKSGTLDVYEPLRYMTFYFPPKELVDRIDNDPAYKEYQQYINKYGLKYLDDILTYHFDEGAVSSSFHFDSFSEYLNTIITSTNLPTKTTISILVEIRNKTFFLYYKYPYTGLNLSKDECINLPDPQYIKYSSTFYRSEDFDINSSIYDEFVKLYYGNILIEDFIQSRFNSEQSKFKIQ